MAKTVTITFTDGRVLEVPQTPWAEIQLERHYAATGTDATPIEALYRLAWFCAQSAGQETRDFDVFVKDIAEAEWGDAKPDRPTQPAQPTTE